MTLLSRFFPSFEKPVSSPHYVHTQEESRGSGARRVGIVLLLAASCGVGLALWEPSQTVTSPYVTAAVSHPAAAPAASKVVAVETTAAAADEDDQPAPTVKLSAQCAQRATARRDCARLEAVKESRLNAPEPMLKAPAPIMVDPAAQAAKGPVTKNEPAAPKESTPAQADPAAAVAAPAETPAAAVPAETPAVARPQRTAAAPKARRPARTERADDAPVERLVHVYDQVMPDGRRVPVYRRVGTGALEMGTVTDGEYRPARRAYLDQGPRFFGLQ